MAAGLKEWVRIEGEGKKEKGEEEEGKEGEKEKGRKGGGEREKEEERQARDLDQDGCQPFYNLILKLTSYHFCHTSKSIRPTHTEEENMQVVDANRWASLGTFLEPTRLHILDKD